MKERQQLEIVWEVEGAESGVIQGIPTKSIERVSSRGQGLRLFTAATGVRLPLLAPRAKPTGLEPAELAELFGRIMRRTIADPGGCLLWRGASSKLGYGRIKFMGRLFSPHRIALEYSIGRPLTTAEDTCHRCDNPRCVSPQHLFAGSRRDNVMDCLSKGRMSLPKPIRKLTPEDALRLRVEYAAGASTRALGRRYGIGRSSAHRIAIGEVYRDLPSLPALPEPAPGARGAL